MVTQIMSRSERRMEKRQALFLLVLVLAVALVSFALGVMVGRAGDRSKSAESPTPPERLPVSQASPSSAGPSPDAAAPAADHLTFYDALPKGEQPPLGSGINLPPEQAPPKPAAPQQVASRGSASAQPDENRPKTAVSSPEPVKPAATPVLNQASPPPPGKVSESPRPAEAKKNQPPSQGGEGEKAPAQKPLPSPPAAKGNYVVQVASYPDATSARKLRDRLSGRGFGAYIEEADLGSKGTWYRVVVGSYESDQAASAAASRLKADENVSGMIRRK